ncbi:MAG: hypothetical protein OXF09_08540 [Hyphomicrobiales bacterium]|nr:hypothetical protein [Hyphomicrobiales bacterium]
MKVFDYIDFIEDNNLHARKSIQDSEIPPKEIINESLAEPAMDGDVVLSFRNDSPANSKPSNIPVSFRALRELDIVAIIHAPIASRLALCSTYGCDFLKKKKSNEFFNRYEEKIL